MRGGSQSLTAASSTWVILHVVVGMIHQLISDIRPLNLRFDQRYVTIYD